MKDYKFLGTPAPWHFKFATPETVGEQEVKLDDETTFKYKSIYIGSDKTACTVQSMSTDNFADLEHFEANSYLIANAPLLLEACIEALNLIEQYYHNDMLPHSQYVKYAEPMKQAIEQALNIKSK